MYFAPILHFIYRILFAKNDAIPWVLAGRGGFICVSHNVDGQLLFLLSTNRSGSSPKRTNASCTIVRISSGKSLRCRAISQI